MAFVAAYLLRFDFLIEPFYRTQILRVLPFLLPVRSSSSIFLVCTGVCGVTSA